MLSRESVKNSQTLTVAFGFKTFLCPPYRSSLAIYETEKNGEVNPHFVTGNIITITLKRDLI